MERRRQEGQQAVGGDPMMAAVYCCDGCRLVESDRDSPAPCLLVMHNGEVPKRCVCGKGAETSWRELTRTGTEA